MIQQSSEINSMNGNYQTPSPLRDDDFLICNASPQRKQTINVNTLSSTTETAEPSTPTKKRLQISWHGLLSPQTPTFAGDASLVMTPQTSADMTETDSTETVESIENDVQVMDLTTTLQDVQYEADIMSTGPEAIPNYETLSQTAFSSTTAGGIEAAVELDEEGQYDEVTTCLPTSGASDEPEVHEEPAAPEKEAHEQDAFTSPTGLRRSTRIRSSAKVKKVSQPATSSPKKKNKPAETPTRANVTTSSSISASKPVPNLTEAEPTASPFDTAILLTANLPVLLSDEWQLQYPSGGSTHPSYPWPIMDPRLVFQSHFVPLNNGLPDVAQTPPLVLPMGWKHVSWSGLLPVAFDPYHQAFKLTPVGPMPLTCEELHQGSLHRYVPGGDLHPEFGLLPDVLALSDGSDAEVFNFDYVDWVLPWDGPAGSLVSQTRSEHAGLSVGSGDSASSEVKPKSTYQPMDVRDCPDNIVDLEDAWRWLIGKELNPEGIFVPTPQKTWKGTGIHNSSRKMKAPIPSLMALALGDAVENPEGYLNKQNSREFCAFKSIATPIHANITLLKDTEFTLIEFLAYFPNHCAWRKGADRLARSGMTASDITNTINLVRGLSGDSIRTRSTINSNVFLEKEGAGSTRKAKIVRQDDEASTYTAEGWEYNIWETIDYPLLGLSHGVLELPSGPGAGPITALIHWCRSNGRYRAMLSEVSDLLREASIEPLIEPGESGCPDKEVVGRYTEALKVDRLRVLASTLKKKRQLDDGEEKKDKKRKAE